MRIKKPKIKKVARDMLKNPFVTKTNPVKTKIKKRKDMSANLGPYLHDAKLPSGKKIGAGNVRLTTKRKLTRTKAQYGVHDV
jgi:hypothetical protein